MNDSITLKITQLKEKLGSKLCIVGHHYQTDNIIQHCDITGDSLELSRKIPEIEAEWIVFCGVYFMGESAALLTRPNQKVFLPDQEADCMMALMASSYELAPLLETLQNKMGKVVPIAYVNTSISLKSVVGKYGGMVCTSANAELILSQALKENASVVFVPDKHLGRNTAHKLGLTSKDYQILKLGPVGLLKLNDLKNPKPLWLWPGCCPIHGQCTPKIVEEIRAKYPKSPIYVHPECPPEVVNLCDGAGSTSYLIKVAEKYAHSGEKAPLILGTENNLVKRLAQKFKDYCEIKPLFQGYCPDMNTITEAKLLKLLEALEQNWATPVKILKDSQEPAKAALTRMLHVCATNS